LDWVLDQGHDAPQRPRIPDKPVDASPEETEHWLKEFAEIDDDPELRRFNKMYRDFKES
jgi:hypothetical protein